MEGGSHSEAIGKLYTEDGFLIDHALFELFDSSHRFRSERRILKDLDMRMNIDVKIIAY